MGRVQNTLEVMSRVERKEPGGWGGAPAVVVSGLSLRPECVAGYCDLGRVAEGQGLRGRS